MKAIQRVLTGVAYAAGYFPTDSHWASRLQHLHGEFRRTRADWWSVVFTAGLFIAMGGLLVGFDLRTLRQSEPLFTAAWFSLPALVFFGLAVLLLRRLDTRYQFESGEVRAVRRGKVLWRENLTGLTRVTAMEGRSGLIWMKLTWPDHTRWMELYRSVLAEVQRHSDTASGRERRASSGTSRDAPGR